MDPNFCNRLLAYVSRVQFRTENKQTQHLRKFCTDTIKRNITILASKMGFEITDVFSKLLQENVA
jgi:hypothetical protein